MSVDTCPNAQSCRSLWSESLSARRKQSWCSSPFSAAADGWSPQGEPGAGSRLGGRSCPLEAPSFPVKKLVGVLPDPRASKRQKSRETAASSQLAHRSKLQGEEMHSIEFTLRRVELEALRLHLLPGLILLIWL